MSWLTWEVDMRGARITIIGLASTLFVASGVGTATAATATPTIATPDGVVGVPQTIEVRAPQFAGKSVAVVVATGTTQVGTLLVDVNGAGSGSTVWTPPSAGSWQISGAGGFSSATASSLQVAAMPTSTLLYSVNQTQVNAPTTMIASVHAVGGSIAPEGSVTFSTAAGTTLQTVPLTPGGGETSNAYFSWTPTSTGATTFIATYNPGSGAFGTAAMSGSSGRNTIEVVDTNPLVTFRLPGSYRIGEPVNVAAVVNNIGLSGSPAFSNNVNGKVSPISGSVDLVGSVATASWTPLISGNQILTTNFSASNSVASGSSEQAVYVDAPLPADSLTMGPAGQGSWPTTADIPLRTNARVAVATTSLSGSPVSFSESGPCMLSGGTLIASPSSGSCTVTIRSTGNAAYAPVSATYTFDVTAPAKKKR
jgi:hypothetical protein